MTRIDHIVAFTATQIVTACTVFAAKSAPGSTGHHVAIVVGLIAGVVAGNHAPPVASTVRCKLATRRARNTVADGSVTPPMVPTDREVLVWDATAMTWKPQASIDTAPWATPPTH